MMTKNQVKRRYFGYSQRCLYTEVYRYLIGIRRRAKVKPTTEGADVTIAGCSVQEQVAIIELIQSADDLSKAQYQTEILRSNTSSLYNKQVIRFSIKSLS